MDFQNVLNIYNYIFDFIVNILTECGVDANKIPEFLKKDLEIVAK